MHYRETTWLRTLLECDKISFYPNGLHRWNWDLKYKYNFQQIWEFILGIYFEYKEKAENRMKNSQYYKNIFEKQILKIVFPNQVLVSSSTVKK